MPGPRRRLALRVLLALVAGVLTRLDDRSRAIDRTRRGKGGPRRVVAARRRDRDLQRLRCVRCERRLSHLCARRRGRDEVVQAIEHTDGCGDALYIGFAGAHVAHAERRDVRKGIGITSR